MLEKLIKPEAINVDLQSEDKNEVIQELTELLYSLVPNLSREEIIELVEARESKGSTGIGSGIAIPHAISDKISEPVCAVGISKNGIDFDSLDGKPAHIIFMLLFPQNDVDGHLSVMQHLDLVCCNANFYNTIINLSTSSQVAQALISMEENI